MLDPDGNLAIVGSFDLNHVLVQNGRYYSKFPPVTGLVEGLACADPGARTPIGASGNFLYLLFKKLIEVYGDCSSCFFSSWYCWVRLQ